MSIHLTAIHYSIILRRYKSASKISYFWQTSFVPQRLCWVNFLKGYILFHLQMIFQCIAHFLSVTAFSQIQDNTSKSLTCSKRKSWDRNVQIVTNLTAREENRNSTAMWTVEHEKLNIALRVVELYTLFISTDFPFCARLAASSRDGLTFTYIATWTKHAWGRECCCC